MVTGALERQLQSVLHEPEAPAAPAPAAQPAAPAGQDDQPAIAAAPAVGAAANQPLPASSADPAYRCTSPHTQAVLVHNLHISQAEPCLRLCAMSVSPACRFFVWHAHLQLHSIPTL